MNTRVRLAMALLLGVLMSVWVMPAAAAQELFPAGVETEGPGFDDNVADVPVDGGLTLLLAAGAVLGTRRVRMKNKIKG